MSTPSIQRSALLRNHSMPRRSAVGCAIAAIALCTAACSPRPPAQAVAAAPVAAAPSTPAMPPAAATDPSMPTASEVFGRKVQEMSEQPPLF